MKINIGPKLDLQRNRDGSYRFEEHYNFFTEDYGKKPEVVEFHLLEEDICEPERLKDDLFNVSEFLNDKRIKKVSFHYPNGQIPSEINWLNRTLKEIGYKTIRKDTKIPSVEERKERLYETIETIGNIKIKPVPVLVTHKAGIQLEKYFLTKTMEELSELREGYLRELLEEHKELIKHCSKNNVKLGLENTAPPGAFSDKEGFICEQAFEHFIPRLSIGGVYILDICHAAMCSYYDKQNDVKHRSMDSVLLENNPSLKSLEDHIKIASNHVGIMHVSDATGSRLSDEGKPIGSQGSIINWRKTMDTIEQYIKEPSMIIEIIDGHKNYDLISNSIKYLKDNKLI